MIFNHIQIRIEKLVSNGYYSVFISSLTLRNLNTDFHNMSILLGIFLLRVGIIVINDYNWPISINP